MATPPDGDERVLDGAEPTEEVGPNQADADAELCEQKAGDVSVDEVGDCEFDARSEIDEAFPTEPIPMVLDPSDGLPVPAAEGNPNFAPPFTFDTCICLEDDREWVEVFLEDEPDYVGRYGAIHSALRNRLFPLLSRFTDDGEERAREVVPAEKTVVRWGQRVIDSENVSGLARYRLVRPKRERCDYYKRQCFYHDAVPNPKDPGHHLLFRNCGARRSVGGAMLSVRDDAVYACDYRSPPDRTSIERYLDGPDREHVRSNAHLVLLPLFNLSGHADDRRP